MYFFWLAGGCALGKVLLRPFFPPFCFWTLGFHLSSFGSSVWDYADLARLVDTEPIPR